MTFLLKQLFSLVKLLNSDTGENQIAAGIACGVILGFAPTFSLQTVLVILLLFFFRIQIGAATLAAFFFKFVAYVFDPVSNTIGMGILEMPSLNSVFTTLYNMPIIPLTRFYNSLVMGSAIVGLIFAPFVFFASRIVIRKYRATIVARYKQTKAWKAFAATGIYQWYSKYNQLYGG